ncbi:protein RETICULATA-RELATED 1, chloroplastic-like isoform X1 [Coffea eugenioides]|uniref:protein RETICULATA-RELATED 1, chloroplastic-like isoform X1 n=1 Tax=Coffea eugenioides TaxID=49369 RepID=UPI000F60B040|nr:protein RETICULATA-RELATED 1, chloroplastic-like isoform X1 [Coffea eugenioides]
MSYLLQSSCFLTQPQSSTSQSTAQNGMFGFGGFGRHLPSICNSAYTFNISQSNCKIIIQGGQVSQQTSNAGSGGNGGNGRPPPSGGGGRGPGGEDNREIPILGLMGPVGFLMTSCWILRNPELADPFLFKAVTEVVTRYSSSIFSGLQKKGKEFWSKLFAVDILFGVAANIALDKMLATYARMGPLSSASSGFLGHLQSAFASLPSSIFEGGGPGFNFSLEQQVAAYFYKGILFGTVGLGCGLTCHNIIKFVMTGNRNTKKSEEGIPVSYIVKNAAFWGVLLPLSSGSRSQIVKGLDRLVQASPLAKQVPLAALAFALGMRLASNIYGGLLFVHWANWSGMMKRES